MYQALRSLGVDTQLVIYPNEYHGITRPSYVRDRLRALSGVVRQIPEEGRREIGSGSGLWAQDEGRGQEP